MNPTTTLKVAASLACLAIAGLAGALTYQTMTLPKLAGAYVDAKVEALGERLDERDAQLKEFLDLGHDFLYDSYQYNLSTTSDIKDVMHNLNEITTSVRKETLPNVNAMLVEAKVTVVASRELLQSMQKDMSLLVDDAGGVLQAAERTLNKASDLLVTVDAQIKEGSPEVRQTIVAARQAISDFDKLMADPSILKTAKNVEGITESTDVIFKRLATKAGVLKTLLTTAVSVIKVNFPF